ncbi:MAG: DUF1549 domain-containing protein [Planctomycetales bacterium]|nr:DUF1549 domain-containing protein [Planctomycetales bacterium]
MYLRAAVTLTALTLLGSAAAADPPGQQPSHSPPELATTRQADRILQDVWRQEHVTPTARCEDGVFLRRVSLDLIGRVPTLAEWRRFEADPDRAGLVAALVESQEFAEFWSHALVTQWYGRQRIPGADREVLRLWLRDALEQRLPYDRIATALIVAEGGSATNGPVNLLLRHGEQAGAKLSRVFLGVRLDCAQCHDHPFDRWTQDDYQRMQRFFAGVRVSPISEGNLRLSNAEPRGGADREPTPRFLTGASPRSMRWRDEFALFAVSSKPFARTFANRVWYHFLGRGIVDPIDDFGAHNPPVSGELLELLATSARSSRFDLRAMCRVICATEAYQASSATDNPLGERGRLFAVRTVKPLTVEQHLRSLEAVAGQALPRPAREELRGALLGEALDEDQSRLWEHRESDQALLTRLTLPTNALQGSPAMEARVSPQSDQSLDILFARMLCRRPTDAERAVCGQWPLAEVAAALLHSHEFCLNH